jgi:multicomponent Na+:H+ antiporter subunit G
MTDWLISILLIAGAFFVMVAGIGILRFKDIFSRLHATTKATSFGVLLLILALVLFHQDFVITLKAFIVIVFIYLTAPLAAHTISKSFNEDNDESTD